MERKTVKIYSVCCTPTKNGPQTVLTENASGYDSPESLIDALLMFSHLQSLSVVESVVYEDSIIDTIHRKKYTKQGGTVSRTITDTLPVFCENNIPF